MFLPIGVICVAVAIRHHQRARRARARIHGQAVRPASAAPVRRRRRRALAGGSLTVVGISLTIGISDIRAGSEST